MNFRDIIREKLHIHNNDVDNFVETFINRFIVLRMEFENQNKKIVQRMQTINKMVQENGSKEQSLYVKCMKLLERSDNINNCLSFLSEQQLNENILRKICTQKENINVAVQDVDNLLKKMQQNSCDNAKIIAVKIIKRELAKTKEIEHDKKLREINELKERRKELNEQIHLQESLIAPFREQLEQHQNEQLELLKEKLYSQKELELLHSKHSQMLGAHNHAEKVKHLIELKKFNYQLEQGNLNLREKIRYNENIIKKIKKE